MPEVATTGAHGTRLGGLLAEAERLAETRHGASVSGLDLLEACLARDPKLGGLLRGRGLTTEALSDARRHDAGLNGRSLGAFGPLDPSPELAAAVAFARERASSAGRSAEPEDCLLGLAATSGMPSAKVLSAHGLSADALARTLTLTAPEPGEARVPGLEARVAALEVRVLELEAWRRWGTIMVGLISVVLTLLLLIAWVGRPKG